MLRRPHVADAQEAEADPLESCLLDRKLFIGSTTNATNARYHVEDPGGIQRDTVIQVSLFVARPPRVSNILICCAGTRFTQQPVVVATLGGLVLLAIPFRQNWSSESQLFLYQPGTIASLYPIPQPSSGTKLCTAGVVPNGSNNGDYLITALENDEDPGGELDLFLYSSATQTWTVKRPVSMMPPRGFLTYKVIPVGSGSSMVAFVDIWTSILFCDVLDGDRPRIHHLPLPSTCLSEESTPRVSSVSRPRDVAIEQVLSAASGDDLLRIRFVDVVCHPLFKRWRATLWTTTVAAVTPWRQLDGWRRCSDVEECRRLPADNPPSRQPARRRDSRRRLSARMDSLSPCFLRPRAHGIRT
uniref:Uncharacterized protein n=1 Tax=Avena sativa TaxID=4498 RepID=A0ACD5W5C7_AVESA